MALPDYPITRNEQYLNRAAGGSGAIPDYPITREEQYLAKIAEGGGGGDGGVFRVSFSWGEDDTLVSDKSFDEIYDAIGSGKVVQGYIELFEEPIYFNCSSSGAAFVEFYAPMFTVDPNDPFCDVYFIQMNSDNEIKAGMFAIQTFNWTIL